MVQNRILWVDIYKTIAIFLIVLGHTYLHNVEFTQFIFLFHVPLFFFISGYLEKTESCDAVAYIKKMLYSLVLPYYLWNVISVVFRLPVTIGESVRMLLGLSLWNGASWFIMVLVLIKIVTLTLRNHKYIITTIFIVGMIILFFSRNHAPYYANLAFLYVPFYFAGMYGKTIVNKFVSNTCEKRIMGILTALLGLVVLLLLFQFSDVPHTDSVMSFIPKFYFY